MQRTNAAHVLGVDKSGSLATAEEGIRTRNLLVLGLGLHTAADYYSHAIYLGSPHSVTKPTSMKTYRNPGLGPGLLTLLTGIHRRAFAAFEQMRVLWGRYRGKAS